MITRSFFGNEAVFAPKSLFTVFRVPLIEIACAAAIEVMRRKFVETNANYYLMWSILLFTTAFKSLFQAFEIISSKTYAELFYYLTFAVVIIGIISALFAGRKFFSSFFSQKWTLNGLEKTILAVILIAYLGLAIVPVFVFK